MSAKSMDDAADALTKHPTAEYIADFCAMFRADVRAGLHTGRTANFCEMARYGWIHAPELRELATHVLLRYRSTWTRIDAAHALASLGAEGRAALVEALADREPWHTDPELESTLRYLLGGR